MTPLVGSRDTTGSAVVDRIVRSVLGGRLADEVTVRAPSVWRRSDELTAQLDADAADRPLLMVRSFLANVLVGPLVRPGQPGCASCCDFWLMSWLRQRNPDLPPEVDWSEELGGLFLDVKVARAAEALGGEGGPRLQAISPGFELHEHRFFPDPYCSRCGDLIATPPPPDEPDAPLRTTPLPSSQRFRHTLHDERLGPVGHVWAGRQGPFALVGVETSLLSGTPGEAGYGRATSYLDGEAVGFAESVERLCSSVPWRPAASRYAPAADLERPVDVRALGEHEPEVYDDERNEFRAFDESLPTYWVTGHDRSGAAWQVPEHVAYWGLEGRLDRRATKFVLESSSGCALGTTLADAAIMGLFEVIERDGFLWHWLHQDPGTRLDFTAPPPWWESSRVLAGHVGYEIELFDQSTDLGPPVVTCLARTGDTTRPHAFLAAGAHLDIATAARSATFEALTNLILRNRTAGDDLQASLDRADRLVDGEEDILDLRDHPLAYQSHRAAGLLAHYDRRGPTATVDPSAPPAAAIDVDAGSVPATELFEALAGLVAAATGHEPIVVDQTGPPASRLGLRVVKVVAPGTVPMVFGHRFQRIRGIDRVAHVKLADVPPHPFP